MVYGGGGGGPLPSRSTTFYLLPLNQRRLIPSRQCNYSTFDIARHIYNNADLARLITLDDDGAIDVKLYLLRLMTMEFTI